MGGGGGCSTPTLTIDSGIPRRPRRKQSQKCVSRRLVLLLLRVREIPYQ